MASDQFDLLCVGTRKYGLEDAKATTERYRIDLAAKRWCYKECDRTYNIYSVTPSAITLQQEVGPELGSDGSVRVHEIDRSTGELDHYRRQRSTGVTYEIKAACEQAPFSGMPKPRF